MQSPAAISSTVFDPSKRLNRPKPSTTRMTRIHNLPAKPPPLRAGAGAGAVGGAGALQPSSPPKSEGGGAHEDGDEVDSEMGESYAGGAAGSIGRLTVGSSAAYSGDSSTAVSAAEGYDSISKSAGDGAAASASPRPSRARRSSSSLESGWSSRFSSTVVPVRRRPGDDSLSALGPDQSRENSTGTMDSVATGSAGRLACRT